MIWQRGGRSEAPLAPTPVVPLVFFNQIKEQIKNKLEPKICTNLKTASLNQNFIVLVHILKNVIQNCSQEGVEGAGQFNSSTGFQILQQITSFKWL